MTFTFRQSAALARVLLVARPSRRPLVTMEAPPPPAGLPYGELARTLDAVEAEPARLEKEALMASLLERAWGASADDLLGCVALTSQQLTPATRPLKLGVGDALVLDALARVCDGDADALKAELRQRGDLGALAAARREGAPPPAEPLTLAEVRAAMLEIPADSGKGKGANERKASLVAALLGRAPPLEAQYIVRSIRGKLRSGLGDRSLRAALAQAAAARSPDADPELAAAEAAAAEAAEEAAAVEAEAAADEKELRKAKRKAAAAAKKAEKERGVSRRRAVALVDEAFKVQPCYHQLVEALVTQGVWALDVKERAGMPIQAMTANPALSIDDVLKRFGDAAAFLAEEKYDGERCQVHLIADDAAGGAPRVQLFSRQLDEKMTARFPELTAALPAALGGTSAIIDTEIVAYNVETGRPLPISQLAKRPKKAPTQKQLEQIESGELAQVCLLAFDLSHLAPLTAHPTHPTSPRLTTPGVPPRLRPPPARRRLPHGRAAAPPARAPPRAPHARPRRARLRRRRRSRDGQCHASPAVGAVGLCGAGDGGADVEAPRRRGLRVRGGQALVQLAEAQEGLHRRIGRLIRPRPRRRLHGYGPPRRRLRRVPARRV
jgi:ATP-dependent DNA ligase